MRRKVIKNKKYKIIDENKTVYCTGYKKHMVNELYGLKTANKIVLSALLNYLDFIKPQRIFDLIDSDKIDVTAVCKDEDTYDEKTGIDICAAKIDFHNHTALAKECKNAYKVLGECMNWLYAKGMYHSKKADILREDMKRMYGIER